MGAHIIEQLLQQGSAVKRRSTFKSNADDISKLFPIQKLGGTLEMKIVSDFTGLQADLFDGVDVIIHATPPPSLAPSDGRQVESTPEVTTKLLDAIANLPIQLIYIALDKTNYPDVLRETIEDYVSTHTHAFTYRFIHAPRVLGPFLNPEHETLNPSNQTMWNVIVSHSTAASELRRGNVRGRSGFVTHMCTMGYWRKPAYRSSRVQMG